MHVRVSILGDSDNAIELLCRYGLLYIDLSSKQSAESREVSPGIVLDYNDIGELVGIDIDNASKKLDLKKLTIHHVPAEVHIL